MGSFAQLWPVLHNITMKDNQVWMDVCVGCVLYLNHFDSVEQWYREGHDHQQQGDQGQEVGDYPRTLLAHWKKYMELQSYWWLSKICLVILLWWTIMGYPREDVSHKDLVNFISQKLFVWSESSLFIFQFVHNVSLMYSDYWLPGTNIIVDTKLKIDFSFAKLICKFIICEGLHKNLNQTSNERWRFSRFFLLETHNMNQQKLAAVLTIYSTSKYWILKKIYNKVWCIDTYHWTHSPHYWSCSSWWSPQ